MKEVLFEDNHLLVLDKPADLLTQPTQFEIDSLETRAKAWLKRKYQKPGNVFLHAVHRIDKGASGIVLFAKTKKALSRLSEAVRNRQVKKSYHALVDKVPCPHSGTLIHYLLHDHHLAKVVEPSVEGAKKAVLEYRLISDHLLEIDLITGRYHQIRAQLSAIGSPILGDKKYGSQELWDYPGIALHHFHFEFPHPIGGKVLVFETRAKWV